MFAKRVVSLEQRTLGMSEQKEVPSSWVANKGKSLLNFTPGLGLTRWAVCVWWAGKWMPCALPSLNSKRGLWTAAWALQG